MNDEQRGDVQAEFWKQMIGLGFAVVLVVMFSVGQRQMSDPDFITNVKRRFRSASKALARHEYIEDEVKRFRRSFSEWEHQEMGR